MATSYSAAEETEEESETTQRGLITRAEWPRARGTGGRCCCRRCPSPPPPPLLQCGFDNSLFGKWSMDGVPDSANSPTRLLEGGRSFLHRGKGPYIAPSIHSLLPHSLEALHSPPFHFPPIPKSALDPIREAGFNSAMTRDFARRSLPLAVVIYLSLSGRARAGERGTKWRASRGP